MRKFSTNIHTRIAILRRDRQECRHCGAIAKNIAMEIDHIIPLSRGGRDIFSNLQALCRPCNRKKGNRFAG
jgi:5-methylcytosine-specific restriction endonuclease McrA